MKKVWVIENKTLVLNVVDKLYNNYNNVVSKIKFKELFIVLDYEAYVFSKNIWFRVWQKFLNQSLRHKSLKVESNSYIVYNVIQFSHIFIIGLDVSVEDFSLCLK